MAAPIASINTCATCGEPVSPTSASTASPHGARALTSRRRKKAALEWAEALTRVEQTHAPDAACEPLARHYDSKQVANITYAIALMNAWNRVAIGFHEGPKSHPEERRSA
jgi:alkylhydroperoxidase family enzyme